MKQKVYQDGSIKTSKLKLQVGDLEMIIDQENNTITINSPLIITSVSKENTTAEHSAVFLIDGKQLSESIIQNVTTHDTDEESL